MPRILLLFLLFLLPACEDDTDVQREEGGELVRGSAEASDQLSRTVALNGRTLVLDGFSGRVRVTTVASGDEAVLTFTKRTRARNEENARRFLDWITIEESGDDAAYRYVMRSERPTGTSVDVEARVPDSTSIHIELLNGNVEVEGLAGNLRIETQNAAVSVSRAASRVLRIEANNGEISAHYLNLPDEADVDLITVNGGVTLGLPASASVAVEAEAENGSIRVQQLQFQNERLRETITGGRFTGALGTGTGRATLRTTNGTVTLVGS